MQNRLYITCNLSPFLMYKPLTLLLFYTNSKLVKPHMFAGFRTCGASHFE
nr:MAG TPA_asm: hypothetical protein [Bacteriophage sp.]